VSAKKIAMMGKNPKVCFEVDLCDTVIRSEVPCAWGMRYRSVIGFGRASLIADNNEKKQGLNCILSHYGGRLHEFSDDEIRSVCVIRIDIDSMTGKKHD
jgi:nitroimidazol reductase NimA-like FMN-containing flavoprotein (pyridoxamine 5'-phosphate oxidase superfamily)